MCPSKPCRKCGEVLPLEEFYPHKRMADGRLNKCISCAKTDMILNREKNIKRYRQYDRRRARRPGNTWANKYLWARRAHREVHQAVLSGRLKRMPCLICGSRKAVAHHEDYSHPLYVMWLCTIHHKARHKELKQLGIDIYETLPLDSWQ